MSEDKALKQAKEEYDKIIADEHERSLIKLRKKYMLDQNTLKYESYESGKKDGMEQGRKLGIQQERIEIAKKLLKTGMDIKEIEKATGLTQKELEKIKP